MNNEQMLLAWFDRAKAEALAWHKAKGISQDRLNDFSAGWRQLLKSLRLHGFLEKNNGH